MKKQTKGKTKIEIQAKKDILNRQGFINDMITIVDSMPANKRCAFALNGDWGSGKSSVLEIFGQQTKDKFLIFNYNCWNYDFYDEPLIAILSVFIDEINKLDKNGNNIQGLTKATLVGAKEVFCGVSGKISEFLTGVNSFEIASKAKGEMKKAKKKIATNKDVDDHLILKNSITAITKELEKICAKTKLVIVVDELDRCLPDYAIKVLERLHHLFENLKNSILILSVDEKQLNNSVKKIFANEVIVKKYLGKFIDFTMNLDYGDLDSERFLEKLDDYHKMFDNKLQYKKEWVHEFINNLFEGIEMREKIKLVERAELIHRTFIKESPDYSVMCFELMWIVLVQQGEIHKSSILINMIDIRNCFGNYHSNFKLKSGANKYLSEMFQNAFAESGGNVHTGNSINLPTNYLSGMTLSQCTIPQLMLLYFHVFNTRYTHTAKIVDPKIAKNIELIKRFDELVKRIN